MPTMKRSFYYLCILLPIVLSACKDSNNDDDEEDSSSIQLVESISTDDGFSIRYEYSDNHRITKKIVTDKNIRTVTYTYNDAGDLVSEKSDNGRTVINNTFNKSGQDIVITSVESGGTEENTTVTTLKLDENDRVSSWVYDDSGYSKFSYDNKGNVTKIEYYEDDVCTYISEYSYNDSPSPFSSWSMPQWYFIYEERFEKKNNAGSITGTDLIKGTGLTTEYQYAYNNAGYPASVTENISGKEYVTSYTYIRKTLLGTNALFERRYLNQK